MHAPIRILIIDDSLVFREALARGLGHEPSFNILPTAASSLEAVEKIKQYQPHILVCDIEMPGMNGLDFLSFLNTKVSIPTIMLSSRDDLKESAQKRGAAAFLSKPKIVQQHTIKNFMLDMMRTIVNVTAAHYKQQLPAQNKQGNIEVIAIGASTGGTEAITTLLKKLPANMPPIVITQHIPAQFSTMFAKHLNELLPFTVKEADKIEPLLANHVYIAPGDIHMSIKRVQDKLVIQCRDGEKINGHRPSVDLLFHSIIEAVGHHAIGVLLTGMGKDGALGLLHMRQAGCYTIGQDEKSSVVYGMPKAAYELGGVCKQVPLEKIAHEILLRL